LPFALLLWLPPSLLLWRLLALLLPPLLLLLVPALGPLLSRDRLTRRRPPRAHSLSSGEPLLLSVRRRLRRPVRLL